MLEQLSQRCHISPLCKEIFYLLQKPHFQVHVLNLSHKFNEHFCFFFFRFDVFFCVFTNLSFPNKTEKLTKQCFCFSTQSLLATHDAIAQKDFYPHLPEIPIEVDEDEETVKIVQLVKSNEPLVCIHTLSNCI